MAESNSAWLKLVRASKQLETLRHGIAADSNRELNEVLLRSQLPSGKPTLSLPEPDAGIAILAGEIIYQLRSALDHLAFDLVQCNKNGITLPTDWGKNCAFPTWTELRIGQMPPLPYGVFKNLPGIPAEAHTIIERVQPYYPVGAANGWLERLAALSNIDKHRRFALTRTRASYRVNLLMGSGIRSSGIVNLDHGAELPTPLHPDEPDTIVEMDRSISLFAAFDEPDALGDATTMRIEQLLEEMLVSIIVDIYNPLRGIITR